MNGQRPKKADQRFDDGALTRPDFRDLSRPRGDHKTAQLCAQIQRALELALLGACSDEVLMELQVIAVEPAPDSRRLRVVFVVPDSVADLGREEIERRLQAERDVLTAEVVQSIHRRKCPELVFELVRE